MIHKLSRNGGALCGHPSVPLTAIRDVMTTHFNTDFTVHGSGDCFECDAIHTGAVLQARGSQSIVSMELQCPKCNRFHVDREEWYHKPHHTHLCEHCGAEWYVAAGARGIEPVSVRGRLISLRHMLADWLYQRLS